MLTDQTVQMLLERKNSPSPGGPAACSGANDRATRTARELARRMRGAIGAGRCAVYLRDAHDEQFRGVAADADDVGDTVGIERLRCGGLADGFTREILERGAPAVVLNARSDRRPLRAAVRRWSIESILGVPLVADDAVVGIAFLDDPRTRRTFADAEIALASSIASIAAIAIAEARRADTATARTREHARQFGYLREASRLQAEFLELVVAGASLRGLVELVTRRTGNPCAIYGDGGRRLAGNEGGAPRAATPLDPELVGQADVAAALRGIEPGRTAVVGPFSDPRIHRRFAVAHLASADEPCGHVVVAETRRRIDSLGTLVVQCAAAQATLQLVGEARARNAEAEADAAVMRDLRRADGPDAALRRRAERLGVVGDRDHLVAAIGAASGGPVRVSTDAVKAAVRAVRGVAGAGLVWRASDAVVYLLVDAAPRRARKARASAGDEIERILGAIPGGEELIAGISGACRVPEGAARGFDEAQRVLDHLRRRHRPGAHPVLANEELGVAQFVLGSTDPDGAERFARKVLGPLASVPPVLETVGAFLDAERSVRRAAHELGVHQNTVRYRLARVHELTGLDLLRDPEHQTVGLLALTVVRVHDLELVADGTPDPEPSADEPPRVSGR